MTPVDPVKEIFIIALVAFIISTSVVCIVLACTYDSFGEAIKDDYRPNNV